MRPFACELPTFEGEWLVSRLQRLGLRACERRHYLAALSCFECAFGVAGGTAYLLSATNMRLNLGQWGLARELYKRVLAFTTLSDAARSMASRKLAEVSARITEGAAPPQPTPHEEASQLIASASSSDEGGGGGGCSAAAAALPPEERARVVRLLRHSGFSCNQQHDYVAAGHWFDVAATLTGSSADLLSAANMRQKRRPGCAVAEALYEAVLRRGDELSEKEREVGARKLEAVRRARPGQADEASGEGEPLPSPTLADLVHVRRRALLSRWGGPRRQTLATPHIVRRCCPRRPPRRASVIGL